MEYRYQMESSYYRDFSGGDYYIPKGMAERFDFLNDKLKTLISRGEIETVSGYRIVFGGEFGRYRVFFNVGDVWYKSTESWQGNAERGTLVRIKKVDDSFISYKLVRKFGIYFSVGSLYTLNKWSFLRIFKRQRCH